VGCMSFFELLRRDVARLLFHRGVERERAGVGEVLRFCFNPRFTPVLLIRLASALARARIPVVPRLVSLVNFVVFGLEVAVDSEIGPGLVVAHTQGTVLGARRIGRNALIYHQVTLGAREMDVGFDPWRRPEVGDDVLIGAGAKVLGGVSIGDRAVIGANAVVIRNVPPDSLAVGVPAEIRPRIA
jgi:serine O-acetyltransferase